VVVGLAVVFILLHQARRAPRLFAAMAGVLVIGVAAQSLGFVAAREQFEGPTLAESMQAAASDDRTYEWRRDYWYYTVETHRERGPAAIVLGAGYGAPWMTFGPLVNRPEGPHNQYLEFFVRYGLVGALAFAWLLAWCMWRLWQHRRRGSATGLSNYGLLVLVMMHSVWSIAYWLDSWQPVLLGLVVAAAAGGRGVPRPTGSPRGSEAESLPQQPAGVERS
jgi:O-antigen ligase